MSDKGVLGSSLTLAGIAAICTTLVAATYQLTAARIVANEKALLEQSLVPALSGVNFDSGVSDSRVVIQPPHALPGDDLAYIYRVFTGEKPAAALFAVTARDGYSGPIRVLVGVEFSGSVSGVRILQHRETPGLGDKIDSEGSDWVFGFDGRWVQNPAIGGWAIKADGGEFDQLTGASITPRAIVKAVRNTLIYFDANRDAIFSMAPTAKDK